ncbi:HAMP domain-containing histidine kinase [Microbispora sp. RL4-1S]|uniref:histidine kinase n=1 Tax=Microbispora oryzae TaxID=2806554 RepID=A0A941AML8_9ACTN|nr:HAMP domain-containing sensor histidine kinase [Microbispora oryzae]MBP2707443.1 HAMP domain-containing histidine kinase [Microbispora oryzae]
MSGAIADRHYGQVGKMFARLPRPRSIRARYTLVAAALSLVFLGVVGAYLDVVTRYKAETDAYRDTEHIATQWSAAARAGTVPRTIPVNSRVELIQETDAEGRVIAASKAVRGMQPLTHVRPPPDDRFKSRRECQTNGRCIMVMAIRVTPDVHSPYIYAALYEPALLAGHLLEVGIAACALPVLGLVIWMTWSLVGRTLRPVEDIRSRISEITVSDLSLRVPMPPGRDEISMLASTANETLARLEAAVKQQRRFASDASHELRTPIAGLRAGLEEALLYPREVDSHKAIRSALVTTDRLEAIINDLLVLARLRASDPKPPEVIDLSVLVGEVAGARARRPPITVVCRPDVKVRGSRIQLQRLVENLLVNAQRHAATAVAVSICAGGERAVLRVTDDGNGIAPEDRERVFVRFVRLDEGRRKDPGGSGLGLAISREIAETHGGTLVIEDSPLGACFVLRLPLARR